MKTMIETIRAARGNRDALLALASEETMAAVQQELANGPAYVKFSCTLAQRLFDAKSVTIKGSQQTHGSRFKKRYDLTDPNQACEALRWWGVASLSLRVWKDTQCIGKYWERVKADPTQIYRHCVQTLSLTRHNS